MGLLSFLQLDQALVAWDVHDAKRKSFTRRDRLRPAFRDVRRDNLDDRVELFFRVTDPMKHGQLPSALGVKDRSRQKQLPRSRDPHPRDDVGRDDGGRQPQPHLRQRKRGVRRSDGDVTARRDSIASATVAECLYNS